MNAILKIGLLALACSVSCASGAEDEVAAATLTKVGQLAPDFTTTSLKGETLSLAQLRGRVVVLSFFATWCGPCQEELPHIERELWQALRAQGLVVIGIDREEKPAVITPFVKKLGLTFSISADPERAIYGRYAKAYIPRAYVIAPDGTIAFQTAGSGPEDFAKLVAITKQLLAKAAAK
jgi:peroxiredoxin